MHDRERALEQALALDDELKNGHDRGLLHGIPIGIKDIIDVAGVPTACGAKRWLDRIANQDAEVVANLRAAGAVIMGKTVTTPYAWIDPPITRNPWNLERTPGGSSSGSAAAVACGMCFGAIGTQTGGSITRPASFCGVAGMKPSKYTQQQMDLAGIQPFAPSLDHVGPIARTVEDLRILRLELGDTISQSSGGIASWIDNPPRIGRLRGFFERRADRAVLSMLDDAICAFERAGARIIEVEEPIDFESVLKDHRIVMAAEASVIHGDALREFPDDYPPRIRDLIEEGSSSKTGTYVAIKDRMKQLLQSRSLEVPGFFEVHEQQARAVGDALHAFPLRDDEVWITPATVGPAPDRSTTGDPSFNSPWSFTGLPTVSFPIGLSPEGMPVAVQLIGGIFRDFELLRIANWCEQQIRAQRE
jgi:Asp-tRNA(Asn)/Glu-tRNA(Gln) amidotransferase A subunit family amidase